MDDCLSEDQILDLVERRLADVALRQAEEHIASCVECRLLVSELARQGTGTLGIEEPTSLPAPNQDMVPLPGTVVQSKYRIERVLGRGGMGVVLEATHLELGMRVALKVPLQGAALGAKGRSRFLREARAVAALKSDFVARVLDAGAIDDGPPYLVMELLEGESVDKTLAREGALSVDVSVRIAIETCRALEDAHAQGIVHRDIKPSNLFLVNIASGRRTKVLDFGIARIVDGSPLEGLALTSSVTGQVIGTPRYASPEQLSGRRTVDHRTDIWSLGITLYEMLTGRSPFDSSSLAEYCMAITQAPPRANLVRTSIPEGLATIVDRCLRVDPSERFQSVADLARSLSNLGDTRARPGYTGERDAVPHHRRARVLATLVIASFLGASLVTIWFASPNAARVASLAPSAESPPKEANIAAPRASLATAASELLPVPLVSVDARPPQTATLKTTARAPARTVSSGSPTPPPSSTHAIPRPWN